MHQTNSNQCIGNSYSLVLRAENLNPKLILLEPKARIMFTFTTQRFRPKQQTQRASSGQIKRERTTHYYKQKKKKTKITSKGKVSLNYREINNKEARQVNDNSRKEESTTRSLKPKLEGGVESLSWWGCKKRPSRGWWVAEHAEEIGGTLKWREKFE